MVGLAASCQFVLPTSNYLIAQMLAVIGAKHRKLFWKSHRKETAWDKSSAIM